MIFNSAIFPIAFVVMRCLGTGAFYVPTMLASIGHSAYISWLLTFFGAVSVGLVFVNLSMRSNSATLTDLIADNFEHKRFISSILFVIYILSVLIGNVMMFQIANSGIQGLLEGISGNKEYATAITLIILLIMARCRESRFLDLVLSIVKIIVMLFVPIIAIFLCKQVPAQVPTTLSCVGIAKGMMMTLFTFVGVESIMNDADLRPLDARYGIIIGSGICLAIYILNTYAIFNYVPDLLRHPIADQKIIQEIAPNGLFLFNIFLIFIGTTGINSWNLSLVTPLKNKIERLSSFFLKNPFIIDYHKKVSLLVILFINVIFLYIWANRGVPLQNKWITSTVCMFYTTIIWRIGANNYSENVNTCVQTMLVSISLFFKELISAYPMELALSLAINLTAIIYLMGIITFAKNQSYAPLDISLLIIASTYVAACLSLSFYESYMIIVR